jgi:putative tricarboxylic transport membrane protein
MEQPAPVLQQTLMGAGVLAVAALLAAGAVGISSEAGYSGVGPNFLPWLVAAALAACGTWMVWEARTGGFRNMEPAPGAARAWWPGFVWVSAGLLANAALITTIGFVLSCAVCYLLAVQGLRRAQGQAGAARTRTLAIDLGTGLAIAAPVYWVFTKLLAINLPGLTGTGWI